MSKICKHPSVDQSGKYHLPKFAVNFEIAHCLECGNLVARKVDDYEYGQWYLVTKLTRTRKSITRGLIVVLMKMHARIRDKQQNVFDMSDDTKAMTPSEYNSIQRLRYWNLIFWVENQDGQKRKTGQWLITRNGAKFLRGDLAIPKWVWTQNGHVVDKEAEMVTITDLIKDHSLQYWETRDDILFDTGDASQKQLF